LGAGIKAVVAVSFGRIFYRNAINVGLPAIECPSAVDQVSEGQEVVIDLERSRVRVGEHDFQFVPFPPQIREILDAGGVMPLLRQRLCT
jgi:3-isopropylmalate/(R)-2-methylmalate dehydratase small subunit